MKFYWMTFFSKMSDYMQLSVILCIMNHVCYLYYHSATTQGHEMPAIQDSFKPALDSYYSQHDCWMEGLIQENFFRFSEENLVKETNAIKKFFLKNCHSLILCFCKMSFTESKRIILFYLCNTNLVIVLIQVHGF